MIPALDIAKFCQEIYPYTYPVTVQRDDVRVYVRDLPAVRMIGFGATHLDNIEDVLRDAEALPLELPDIGTVHQGFGRGAQYVIADVLLAIDQARPFILVGHSLGGALALNVAAMLCVRGIVPAQITTFGAPRPAFTHLGEILKAVPSISQYRFGDDIVPTVPWEIGGYKHPSQLIQFGTSTGNRFTDHEIVNYLGTLAAS